jgi:hypothetical protein
MQFSRDLSVPQWHSKFNVLARMCAMYDHRSCWASPECRDPVVVQCGDGRILGPDGIEGRPHMLVLHDWDERYAPMVNRATRVVTFGKLEGAPAGATVLESFPLPDLPVHPVHPDNGVLVAGTCTDDAVSFASDVLDGADMSLPVTVALYDRGSSRTEGTLRGLVYGEKMASFGKVTWKRRQSYPMIVALYLTAGCIVHCGSGRRGFLHALAVRAASAGAGLAGAGLVTRGSDNDFEPTGIRQFLEAMGARIT